MRKKVSNFGISSSFEKFQKIVKKKNLVIKAGLEMVPNSKNTLVWQPYFCISSSTFDYLKSFGTNPERAFGTLKKRLLAGEIINTGRDKKFQLTQTREGAELCEI